MGDMLHHHMRFQHVGLLVATESMNGQSESSAAFYSDVFPGGMSVVPGGPNWSSIGDQGELHF